MREVAHSRAGVIGLLEIMERENQDYKVLFDYSLRKREALLSNDIEGLVSITTGEEKLIQEVQQAERERLELLNRLAVEFNIPASELNLKRLAELVTSDLSEQLVSIGDDLKTTIRELSFLNQVNSRLIGDTLAFTTHILEVITQEKREKSTYKERGQKERRKPPLVVDRRV
ncbi:TPA: hypothetical protein DCX15_06415 [bacterium]|nr:hypothetical protein [bacterium]